MLSVGYSPLRPTLDFVPGDPKPIFILEIWTIRGHDDTAMLVRVQVVRT